MLMLNVICLYKCISRIVIHSFSAGQWVRENSHFMSGYSPLFSDTPTDLPYVVLNSAFVLPCFILYVSNL